MIMDNNFPKSPLSTPGRRAGLLKHQLHLIKRRDCDRYEIVPIPETLSFEKGLFIFIRACQLLAQNMEGVILVGLAGPSGAGKTVFCEKLMGFMPGIAVISMDNYNDASRLIDGNFDDPRLTDYDLLLENINGLKSGNDVEVPVYDFKVSQRVGFRQLKVPPSRIVVIEGIYALSEKLRPLLDLRVSVRGGVHFDLVKRVLRDINRAGQEPEEIIHQISETVYPMYKAFIEPDLDTAHIKIINKFNPFSGFQHPTYILKSTKTVTEEQIRKVLSPDHVELNEETYDIYLLPPGDDPETCQSYLRMRNRDGKYSLIFEEVVTDDPFIISPRITFEVSVRLLGGLMALGYTIATILKRISHVFSDEKLCIKIDKLEQLQRKYVQVQGKDRNVVSEAARCLGLGGTYIPHSYIEQIQLEKLISGLMGPSEDLKAKLSLHEDVLSPTVRSPILPNRLASNKKQAGNGVYSKSLEWTEHEVKDVSFSLPSGQTHARQEHHKLMKQKLRLVVPNGHSYSDRPPDSPYALPADEVFANLSEKLSNLNERLEAILSRLGDVENKLTTVSTGHVPCQQNMIPQFNSLGRSLSQQNVSSTLQISSNYSSAQQPADSFLLEEVKDLARKQQQLTQQVDVINICIREALSDKQNLDRQSTDNIFGMSSSSTTTLGLLSLGFVIAGVIGFRVLQKAK